MTCKNCVHCDVCCCERNICFPNDNSAKEKCKNFQDKSRLAPCDIGDVVYLIDKDELEADPLNAQIYEDEVYEIGRGMTSSGEVKWFCIVKDTGLDFYNDDIGMTAFFNYEAAKKALEAKDGE